MKLWYTAKAQNRKHSRAGRAKCGAPPVPELGNNNFRLVETVRGWHSEWRMGAGHFEMS